MPAVVIFDVGGVLLVPDVSLITTALARVGIEVTAPDPRRAHYAAIYDVDDPECGEFWPPYSSGYLRSIGVPDQRIDDGIAAIASVWELPAIDSWSFILPGARTALERLSAAAVPIAIVSNADGTIEESLKRKGLCQVGPGRHARVTAVIDSAIVGIAKPDPRIFEPALDALGIRPGRAFYVGDSERIDVCGADNAGLVPVHLDPYGTCRHPTDHAHIVSLDEIDELLEHFDGS